MGLFGFFLGFFFAALGFFFASEGTGRSNAATGRTSSSSEDAVRSTVAAPSGRGAGAGTGTGTGTGAGAGGRRPPPRCSAAPAFGSFFEDAFFAFFAGARGSAAPGSSGRRFLAARAQCSGSMTCRASAVMPSSSRSRAPASATSSMAASAALKASASVSTVGEGSPLYTLEGTRQHSRCTKRPYAPETISIVPTRTAFFEMKHALFGSAA